MDSAYVSEDELYVDIAKLENTKKETHIEISSKNTTNLNTNVLNVSVEEKLGKIISNFTENNINTWLPILLLDLSEFTSLKEKMSTSNNESTMELSSSPTLNLKRKNQDETEGESLAKKNTAEIIDMESNEKDSGEIDTTKKKQEAKEMRRKRNQNMYKDTRTINKRKPNTIVFALSEKQTRNLKSTNFERIITTQTGAQTTSTKLVGNKLYIYPHTQTDFEAIVTCKSWEFEHCQRWVLDNRDYIIIITHLGIEDVEYNNNIKMELEKMGIIKCEPLIEDDREYLAIKALCRNKEDCKSILEQYYIDGKKFKTSEGKIINAKFGPSVSNPKQCFNCYKFDTHIANECSQDDITCEKCGEMGHKKTNCKKGHPNCVNCHGEHEARSRECPIYVAKKKKMTKDILIDITGKAMERPSNKEERRAEAIQKQKEGSQVVENFNVGKQEPKNG